MHIMHGCDNSVYNVHKNVGVHYVHSEIRCRFIYLAVLICKGNIYVGKLKEKI